MSHCGLSKLVLQPSGQGKPQKKTYIEVIFSSWPNGSKVRGISTGCLNEPQCNQAAAGSKRFSSRATKYSLMCEISSFKVWPRTIQTRRGINENSLSFRLSDRLNSHFWEGQCLLPILAPQSSTQTKVWRCSDVLAVAKMHPHDCWQVH